MKYFQTQLAFCKDNVSGGEDGAQCCHTCLPAAEKSRILFHWVPHTHSLSWVDVNLISDKPLKIMHALCLMRIKIIHYTSPKILITHVMLYSQIPSHINNSDTWKSFRLEDQAVTMYVSSNRSSLIGYQATPPYFSLRSPSQTRVCFEMNSIYIALLIEKPTILKLSVPYKW